MKFIVLNNADMPPPVVGQHFSLDLEFFNRQAHDFRTVTIEAGSACFRCEGGLEGFFLPAGGSRRRSVEFTALQPSLGAPLGLLITVIDAHGRVSAYRPEKDIKIPVLLDEKDRQRRPGTKIFLEGKLARADLENVDLEGYEIHMKGDMAVLNADTLPKTYANRRNAGIQVGGGEKLEIGLVFDPIAAAKAEAGIREAEERERLISCDGLEGVIVFRHPVEEFGAHRQLVVHESQEAVFFRNGQSLDLFGPGRHALIPGNLPMARKSMNWDGDRPWALRAELFFVNKAALMTVKWGTPSKVMFKEPESGLPLDIGASGTMRLRAEDARLLLSRAVGAGALPGPENWGKKFKDILAAPLKAMLARAIKSLNISIFEMDEHLDRLSEALRTGLTPEFSKHGLALEEFEVATVVRPDGNREYEDLKKLYNSRFVDVQKAKIRSQTAVMDQETEARKVLIAAEAEAKRRAVLGGADIE